MALLHNEGHEKKINWSSSPRKVMTSKSRSQNTEMLKRLRLGDLLITEQAESSAERPLTSLLALIVHWSTRRRRPSREPRNLFYCLPFDTASEDVPFFLPFCRDVVPRVGCGSATDVCTWQCICDLQSVTAVCCRCSVRCRWVDSQSVQADTTQSHCHEMHIGRPP